jgi:acetylornithine deacetylase/succinyl-diaminopimelate desuccinylase-like protein
MSNLDARIAELSAKYRPLAAEILAEAIRIPADYVDKSPEQGGDPLCGLSNHEGPRLEYLKAKLIEIGGVRSPDDASFDTYGNLVWHLEDPNDPTPRADRKIIYFDGHTDTVKALRGQWIDKIGGGIDAYDGMTDPDRVNWDFLEDELGWLPPKDERQHLLFGRGAADQLSGVVSQLIASKIMVELTDEGALRGAIVRSYATAAEEDNDGGGPMFLTRKVLPGADADVIPDVVILTEGTGDSAKGAVGIYRGQRGRMQIRVTVTGRSCHGSMPWEGLNPLEFGASIIVEARQQYERQDGFLSHDFLGDGSRTASWAQLESPSDCAVPDRFVFRFDRRLTVGEDPADAVAAIDGLPAVGRAREAGLQVEVVVPQYTDPTWRGYVPGNPQIYMGWETPADHQALQCVADVYRKIVGPNVDAAAAAAPGGTLKEQPRVDRWIFSTDGVGFPIPRDADIDVPSSKDWVEAGAFKHPAMFGCGPGIEQNTHKIGEVVDLRELQQAVSVLSRFPSAYANWE